LNLLLRALATDPTSFSGTAKQIECSLLACSQTRVNQRAQKVEEEEEGDEA
jgi:hypothetical protein